MPKITRLTIQKLVEIDKTQKHELRDWSKSTKLEKSEFRHLSKSIKLNNPNLENCQHRQDSNIPNARFVEIDNKKNEIRDLSKPIYFLSNRQIDATQNPEI